MPAVLIFLAFPTFGLATGAGEGLNHRVRFGGWGLINLKLRGWQ